MSARKDRSLLRVGEGIVRGGPREAFGENRGLELRLCDRTI